MNETRLRVYFGALFVAAIGCAGFAILLLPPAAFRPIGDVAYVVATVCVLVIIWPRLLRRALLVATLATGFAYIVELFQLTGIPAAWASNSVLLWLAFGSLFDPLDLLAYTVGGIVTFCLLSVLKRCSENGQRH